MGKGLSGKLSCPCDSIYYWLFQGGTSVVVPKCYMLCLYVNGL